MIKDLINQNSTTRNSKSETTPIVEQHSLWGKQSKILVLGIILLIVFVGLFSPVRKASASEYTQCITDQTVINSGMVDAKGNKDVAAQTAAAQKACSGKAGDPNNIGSTGNSALENNLQSCGVIGSSSLEGCLVKITYIVFYTVPSLLLSVAAEFLDVLLSITLSSALYTKSSFIPNAWAVVRDLSNIF